MLTPVLAFSLAKGSEMGFVSFASGLAQQVAGGARAAAGFAQQQALSTRSDIGSADGSMVSSIYAGRREDVYASQANNSFMQMSSISNLSNEMLNGSVSTAAGSTATMNALGNIASADVKNLTGSSVNSMGLQKLSTLTNALNNAMGSAENSQYIANYLASKGSSSNRNKTLDFNNGAGSNVDDSKTDTRNTSTQDNYSQKSNTYGGASLNANGGGLGGQVGHEESISKTTTDADSHKKDDVYKISVGENFKLDEKDVATLMKDTAFVAGFTNHLSTQQNKSSQELLSQINSFNQTDSFVKSYGTDTEATMVQNYMNAHNLKGTQGIGQALTALETLATRGDLESLSQYAGISNNEGLNGGHLQAPQNINYHNYDKISNQHSVNASNAISQAGSNIYVNDKGEQVKKAEFGVALQDYIGNANDIASNATTNIGAMAQSGKVGEAAAANVKKIANEYNLGQYMANERTRGFNTYERKVSKD